MGGEQNRLSVSIAAQSRDQVRFAGLRRGNDIDFESQRLQLSCQELVEPPFIARRIAVIDAYDLLQ
jgi:hypothetical protein